MDNLYKTIILDHYKNPQNQGVIKNPTHTATMSNPLCGDQIKVFVTLKNNTLTNVKHQTTGCAISTAAASIISDFVKNKTLKQLQSLTDQDIINQLNIDISPARRKCALLFWNALKKALFS